MKALLLSLLFVPILAFATDTMKIDRSGNPILTQYSEEGFVDCVLRIVDLTETSTHYRFRIQASFDGEIVGMNVSVIKNIQGGFDQEMNLKRENVYRRGVTFYRAGAESDRLISALALKYSGEKKALQMVNEESFTAIALHQGELNMEAAPIKIKIFGRDADPVDEDAYYESFFNLDLRNRLVFWNEKDQDYRKPLIQGLSR
ncbi:hypothetical protein [Undibacterium sp.]|uniref:hypothetical protein n=1 Tax=Undibacterium sp. TaxID=1914977 RepID=UPI0037533991